LWCTAAALALWFGGLHQATLVFGARQLDGCCGLVLWLLHSAAVLIDVRRHLVVSQLQRRCVISCLPAVLGGHIFSVHGSYTGAVFSICTTAAVALRAPHSAAQFPEQYVPDLAVHEASMACG